MCKVQRFFIVNVKVNVLDVKPETSYKPMRTNS